MKNNPKTLKLNNDMVDKIRQILASKSIVDKEKVKALKFLLDLDEDSFQTSSAGKEWISDDGYTKLPSLLIYDN